MPSPKYLSGDEIADARNAHGFGVPLATIAAHLGVSVEDLQAALGLPQWREPVAADADCDLWRTDEAESEL